MRRIGQISNQEQAATFRDYLATLGIKSTLDETDGTSSLWIHDEDRVAAARAELDAFQQAPQADKYRRAVQQAQQLRAAELEAELAVRKRKVDLRRKWARPMLLQIPVSVGLVVASIVVTFLVDFGQNDQLLRDVFAITNYRQIDSRGAGAYIQWVPGLDEVRHGQIWRLFTPCLVHMSPLHLVFNMYWTFLLGGAIELRRGSWRLALLVLLIGIVSNVGQSYVSPSFGGMSGVGFGLFGYIWMQSRFAPESGLSIAPDTTFLFLAWLFVCMTGWVGPVANVAHVSGLLVGMAVAIIPALWRRATGRR